MADSPPISDPAQPEPARYFVRVSTAIGATDFEALFAPFEPDECTLMRTADGVSRGFGFLEFKKKSAGEQCQAGMNGTVAAGKPIKITVASGKPDTQAQPVKKKKKRGNQSGIISYKGVEKEATTAGLISKNARKVEKAKEQERMEKKQRKKRKPEEGEELEAPSKAREGPEFMTGDEAESHPLMKQLAEQHADEIIALSSIYEERLRVRFVSRQRFEEEAGEHESRGQEWGGLERELSGVSGSGEGPAGEDSILPILNIPISHSRLEEVQVQIVVQYTPSYPDTPPILRVQSSRLPKEALMELTEALQTYAKEKVGEVMVFDLVMKAEEEIAEVALDVFAEEFVSCSECNKRLLAKKLPKYPQPARSCGTFGGVETYQCLTCKNKETVFLSSLKRNQEIPCDFCFCEENPIMQFACGEYCCVACFQGCAELAVNARNFIYSTANNCWSLPCPNHPNKIIPEVELVRMLPPATYHRFGRFAFEEGAVKAGGVICPLPSCQNLPFWSNTKSKLLRCPCCDGWLCRECSDPIASCTCNALGDENFAAMPVEQDGMGSVSMFSQYLPQEEKEAKMPSGLRKETPFPIRVKGDSTFDNLELKVCGTTKVSWVKTQTARQSRPGGPTRPAELVLFLHGIPLDPRASMTESDIHPGTTLWGMLRVDQELMVEQRAEEIDLWEFRKEQMGDGGGGKKSTIGKPCPFCDKQVIHYWGHGCHHIGFAGMGCCGKHWCYVCRKGYPQHCTCASGGIFCTATCGCPPCPSCKPGQPCSLCFGCPVCKSDRVHDIGGFDF